MLKKYIILSSIILCYSLTLLGQGNRAVPFLELNADVRSAGMGETTMGEAKSMYIYTNPTSFLKSDAKIYSSYTYALFPKVEEGRLDYHATSIGYRLKNQALMAGFRYMGGLAIKRIGEDGTERKAIHPMDWSVDLAYTRSINEKFSAFLGGNFIHSYNSKRAFSYGFSGGLYFRDKINLGGTGKSNYTIGAAIYDLGGKLQYGKNSYNLPTSAGIGSSISIPVSEDHKINVALCTRYFFLPSDLASISSGLGLEYEIFNLISLRGGYHTEKFNNYATLGLGIKTCYVNLDCALLLANSEINSNIFRFGISFNL